MVVALGAEIPSTERCLELLEQYEMPRHIQKHSFKVAELASFLGELLSRRGCGLNLKLILAASILHDIGKARGLQTGEDHGKLGAGILEDQGFSIVAPIVLEHATMDSRRARGSITESLIVNYADKRVRHDQVVTLEERFRDLVDRYGKTPRHQTYIWDRLNLYRQIEQNIFRNLPFNPESREVMAIELFSSLMQQGWTQKELESWRPR